MESITANSTNSKIVEPTDAWKNLRGQIESISIKATASATMHVVFFSHAAGEAGTPADDSYIDHYAFTSGDFVSLDNATVVNAHVNGLSIPYIDADDTKKFHVAIFGAATVDISDGGDVILEWGWRGNAGVS